MKVQSWKCNVRECLYVRGKREGIQGDGVPRRSEESGGGRGLPHLAVVLDPSEQKLPAGHAPHDVRVVVVPPLVNEPTGQVPQMLAPASAYSLSDPHGSHVALPADANFPGAQDDTEPSPDPQDAPGRTMRSARRQEEEMRRGEEMHS